MKSLFEWEKKALDLFGKNNVQIHFLDDRVVSMTRISRKTPWVDFVLGKVSDFADAGEYQRQRGI